MTRLKPLTFRLLSALTLAAFVAACAGDPEARALRAREAQVRSKPALLATAQPAEMPEGRGEPAPPPPRAVAALSPAEAPPAYRAPSPDRGDEAGRLFLEILAIGAAVSLAAAGGNDCPAD